MTERMWYGFCVCEGGHVVGVMCFGGGGGVAGWGGGEPAAYTRGCVGHLCVCVRAIMHAYFKCMRMFVSCVTSGLWVCMGEGLPLLFPGVFRGVLNVVHGAHDSVNRILDHPDIRAIAFVGSDAAGRYIYQRGCANGKRVQVRILLLSCHNTADACQYFVESIM
jgi:hypothetical protein